MKLRRIQSIAIAGSVAAFATLPGRAAAQDRRDGRPVLALLNVRAGDGFAPGDVETVESLLLSALEATGRFHVIGHSDIVTLLDLEAKKQSTGCDDTSCMTAIAGALGAQYVAAAGLGRLGHTMVLSFKVIEVRSASALVHANETVQAKDDLIHAAATVAAETVTAIFGPGAAAPHPDLAPHGQPGEAGPTPMTATPIRREGGAAGHTIGIIGAVLGGIGLAVGTGLGIVASQQTTTARTVPTSTSVQSRVNGVNSLVNGAVIGWAAGGALAVTGVGLLVAF